MKKLIVLGMSNDGFKYSLTLKKEEGFRETFVELMKELGFEIYDLRYIFMKGDGSPGPFLGYLLMNEVNDTCVDLKNDNFEVDLFVGEKKIFLDIRTKKRTKLTRLIENYTEFIKIKPVKGMKNRKEYKKLWKINKMEDKS